jgi:hypothetical protein
MMIALVFAYQRPELTLRLVNRILQINSDYKNRHGKEAFSHIRLIHDGFRITGNSSSARYHSQTRELCLNLESTNSILSCLTFEENIGLTPHVCRVKEELNVEIQNCVLFEEDKAPTLEGVEFLIDSYRSMNSSSMLDTLPLNMHLHHVSKQISTLFTDNGNLVIGDELFETAQRLWIVKAKYREDFEKNLYLFLSSFLSGFALKRAFDYYSKSWSWGLTNKDRPDALLAYALILMKKAKVCPIKPLSENWSGEDSRGMNVNSTPSSRGDNCKTCTTEFWNLSFCFRCERQGVSERVGLNPFSAIRSGFLFRLKSTFSQLS